MSSTILAEDCTEKCKSVQHGKEINVIITKHGRSDEEVLALMKKTCRNFYKVKDEFNRNALHLAASTGRQKLIEWLIKREGCDINAKDSSGYTALHRSVFFGHLDVTRSLIKLGASMNISDNEGYFPLDLIRLDRPKYITNDDKQISEAYVFGLNENYNLGTGTEHQKHVPELVDRMRKLPWGHLGSCFSQISMSPLHTVWLHWSSEVYSCGVGTSGQLGLDSANHAFTPQRIEFRSTERCLQVLAASEHSLFRMETGAVKSCGSNEYFVLGHKQSSSKVLKPKAVDITFKTEFICASKFHSLFLSKNEIYVCGTNTGQMGFDESIKCIVKPRKILLPFEKEEKQEGQLTHVHCNEWATVVCHSRGYICIFKKYRCVTLNTRHFDIQKIAVIGGGLDSDASYSNDIPICVFILLKHGRLLIWHENQEQLLSSTVSSSSSSSKKSSSSSSPQFTIAIFNVGRALTVTDFCVNASSLIIINQGGESFKAPLNLRSNPVLIPNIHASNNNNTGSGGEWGFHVKESMRHQIGKDLFSFMPLELFKVKRINNIYSAIKTYCDCRGNNFAITQVHQKADLLNLPQKMKTTINSDFALLLKETSIDDDIHDVTFKVGNFLFPAHRFIIASTCEVLYREVKKKCEEIEESTSELDTTTSSSSQIIVPIKNVEPRIFELVLQFLYSNQCDIFIPGLFIIYPNDPDWPELLRVYAKKLQLRPLIERLHSCNVRMSNGQIEMSRIINASSVPNIKFDKNSWVSLSDVNLISEDGHEVKAHQCVLVARLEYYKNMLQQNVWFEGNRTSNQQQLKFPGPKSTLDNFVDIMYRGDSSYQSFGGKKDLDILTQALVTSDLLLSPEFLSHFEYLITDYISHENVSQLLHLACMCNAQQLQLGCIEFICLNLAPILENRLLDGLPDEQMKEITRYYKSNFTEVLSRKLNDTSAPHDDDYTAAAEELAEDIELLDHIEDLDFITPKKAQSSKGKLKMRNRTLSSSSGNNNDNNKGGNSSSVDKTVNIVDSTEYYTDNDVHHHDDWTYDSSFEEFTVVSKPFKTLNGQQKQRSPPPPASSQLRQTTSITPKIAIPLPIHSLHLSTKYQTQIEAQQQPVSLGSGFSPKATKINSNSNNYNSRQTNQIAFNEIDFPSFGDVIVASTSVKSGSHHNDNNTHVMTNSKNTFKALNNSSGQRKSNGLINNQNGEIKSNSNIINPTVHPTVSSSSSSSQSTKRKTKWVNLEEKVSSSSSKTSTMISSNGDSSTISASSGRDMKNPWHKLSTPEKNSSHDENAVKFDEIVQLEQLKKENLEKVKAKPLLFHQIEDEAINQLWKRYGNTEDVLNGYELLHVERVSEDYAVPIWMKNL